jgi:hypothetical protein
MLLGPNHLEQRLSDWVTSWITVVIVRRQATRPKDFPIMGLRAAMVCESMCRGVGPKPQLLGVHPLPFDHRKLSWRGD